MVTEDHNLHFQQTIHNCNSWIKLAWWNCCYGVGLAQLVRIYLMSSENESINENQPLKDR